MSFDISVSAYCDGKGCRKHIEDGDYVYCKACAGQDTIAPPIIEQMQSWVDDNALNMTAAEFEFSRRMLESIDLNVPLVMTVRSAA